MDLFPISSASTGRLQAGEQYSVTIRATDAKGLSSQGIVELSVAPGPNTRPPQFSSRDYYAPVSEGAAINSTVTTVTVSTNLVFTYLQSR